jgi:peptidoglycan-N-acetylglucosamine deacetylase
VSLQMSMRCAIGVATAFILTAQALGQDAPRVALTFDDLPSHGPLPAGMSRVDVARSIITTLRSRGTPPIYGFINAKAVADRPDEIEVLRLWREAGFPLGNHAFSHMDLHANTVEAFEQDVRANESTLRQLMGNGDGWRWLRFPYLREGDTAEKHRAITAWLKAERYQVAQVTLSFDDYAYNAPYVRCLAKGDKAGVSLLEQSYLTRAAASLAQGQDAARTLFGRDVPHVMLLHIGAFETLMLPRLLDLLQQRGVTLTTLEAAQADAAYAGSPNLPGGFNGTWLGQWMRARGTPLPPEPGNPLQMLSTVCA